MKSITIFIAVAFILWLLSIWALRSAVADIQRDYNACVDKGGERLYCLTGFK